MGNRAAALLFAAGLLGLPGSSRADLVEKQFVQPGGTGAAAGIVFQGSRNMKDLGKRKRQGTVSSVVVPSLNPVPVIPALENAELRPKPRFGYGSDYAPGAGSAKGESGSSPGMSSGAAAISAPVYPFRYSYPVHRDYWIVSPYQRYFSPYSSCGPHSGWGGWYSGWHSGWSGFSRFSLSFGW